MKNIKKYLLTLLIVVLCVCALVACGDKGQNIGGDQGGQGGNQGVDQGGHSCYDYDLATVFAKYDEADAWNFEVKFDVYVYDMQNVNFTTVYGYKDLFNNTVQYEKDGQNYVDYYSYENGEYYLDNGDGKHVLYEEGSDEYAKHESYVDFFDLAAIKDLQFTHFDESEDKATSESIRHNQYSANDAVTAGNAIFGEWEESTDVWSKVELYMRGDDIYRLVAVADVVYEGETCQYKCDLTFSKFGQIDFDLSTLDVSGGSSVEDGKTYVAEFTDVKFSNESGLAFVANSKPNGFTNGRGVQFMQKDGEVIVSTQSDLSGVTKVTLVLQTNCDTGMNVAVKVGSTSLTSDGKGTVFVEKTNFDVLKTLEFTAPTALDGTLSIILTPTAITKSMYLLSVEIQCGGTAGGDTPTPSDIMPAQNFDASKLDKSTLREKMAKYLSDEGYSDPLPLQSTGTYDLLVVPVAFSDKTISAEQLSRLDKAFNGTSADTGWESVSSYYQKSSYGNLNLSYDIQNTYTSSKTYSYYGNYSEEITIDGETYTKTGDVLLLEEVLAYYESILDLTNYDTDKDGVIDAVYLIYSAPVAYGDDESIYWAYVTTYPTTDTSPKYDGLELGYYLFAGIDFIDEHTGNSNDYYATQSGYTPYAGLSIMAETYIHETGHLLGLDDYYDYDETQGGGEGLGGADMMDYNVGDHNAYSKLILGWIDPTIVTTTQTLNLSSFATSGQTIMVLLDYDGTYFSEYLLIDFYTATGVNEMAANQDESLLYYDGLTGVGAKYGVRVYHVSSSIKEPYSDDYFSFTDNNNSLTTTPLIKLVEADGEKKFASTNGYAEASDLWMAGDKLSTSFANYTRNDGKKVNFDVSVDSVSETGATITITFVE